MEIRFQSVNREEIGYVVDSSSNFYDSRGGKDTVSWARQYQTYGDGLTQHSSNQNISLENLGDFLESLAVYWVEASEEEKQKISFTWRCVNIPSRKRVEFLAGLTIPKEGKRLFYNKDELKSSSSLSKQHDKRWEELTRYMEWVDGSAKAVYQLLSYPDHNYDSVLDTYRKYSHIRDILTEKDQWNEMPVKFIGLERTNGDSYYAFYSSFQAVESLIKAFDLQEEAVRILQDKKDRRKVGEENQETEIAA